MAEKGHDDNVTPSHFEIGGGPSATYAEEDSGNYPPQPYVLDAHRRVRNNDSDMADRVVAMGLANTLLILEDKEAMDGKSANQLRLDGFKHFIVIGPKTIPSFF